uniref:Uncharacterized protein n=1 Tax=Anguilla anguilla TaxID=7936 RepID=A0A0E9R6J5_ANGAN
MCGFWGEGLLLLLLTLQALRVFCLFFFIPFHFHTCNYNPISNCSHFFLHF